MSYEKFLNELPPVEDWGERVYSRPEFDYPEELNAAAELLDRNVREGRAERPAIYYKDEVINYGELLASVNKMGNALIKLGIKPGDRVMLRFPNTPTAVAAWLAVLKVGGVAVTIMTMLRSREISYRANDAECKLVIADAASFEEVAKAIPQMQTVETILVSNGTFESFPTFESLWQNEPITLAHAKLSRYDLSLIGYTSGSTGDAKGTVHFQDDVLAIADGYARNILKPTENDIFTGHPPLAFTFGLGGLLVFPFRFGASVVLLDQFTPENMLKTIANYKATIAFCAPTCYKMMMRLDENNDYDLSHLRVGVSAGETLPKATYERWKAKYGSDLLDGIGSTEMLHIFVTNKPGEVRAGATGKPVPGYEAKIVSEEGLPLPPNTPGLLAIKGPTGCRYWKKPDRQKGYVLNGWNIPGDVFMMDSDGYFYYQCRNDDLIITGGYNVSPPELEAVLNEHPAVKESAIVPAPDELRGSIVKAYIVLKPGETGSDALAKELQDFVKRELAPYKYPRAIEFIEALPRTDTGKVQRYILREQAKA